MRKEIRVLHKCPSASPQSPLFVLSNALSTRRVGTLLLHQFYGAARQPRSSTCDSARHRCLITAPQSTFQGPLEQCGESSPEAPVNRRRIRQGVKACGHFDVPSPAGLGSVLSLRSRSANWRTCALTACRGGSGRPKVSRVPGCDLARQLCSCRSRRSRRSHCSHHRSLQAGGVQAALTEL